MAIINNSYKFVFVHIPKAAGTSITSALKEFTNYCDLEIGGTEFGEQIQPAYKKRFGLSKHSTALQIRNLIGTVQWSQYFTFALVRNPFSRCLSTYNFLRKWEAQDSNFTAKIRKFENFDQYVLSNIWDESNGPDQIFLPQMHWLRAEPKSTVSLVNFFGKVENIDEDFSHILKMIDMRKEKYKSIVLPKLNSSEPSSIGDIKNPDVIRRIVTKYQVDFEEFGYSKKV